MTAGFSPHRVGWLALVTIGFALVALPAAAQGTAMIATIYDDGVSCPGGCDAHVVFAARHNGTVNAFAPGSSATAPARCTVGQPCTICFGSDGTGCLTVRYRGGGPPAGRFDFTPAFFDEQCGRPMLPAAVADKCRGAAPEAARLKTRVNCVAMPAHPKCAAVMTAAMTRKAADDPLYAECITLGEPVFNRKYAAMPAMQRSLNCAYERRGTGRNSRGDTWRRLLDGACRPGTYAGRDGLDCCTGSVMAAAMLGRECRHFFVDP